MRGIIHNIKLTQETIPNTNYWRKLIRRAFSIQKIDPLIEIEGIMSNIMYKKILETYTLSYIE